LFEANAIIKDRINIIPYVRSFSTAVFVLLLKLHWVEKLSDRAAKITSGE